MKRQMVTPTMWNLTLPINCSKKFFTCKKVGLVTNAVATLHSDAGNVATSSVTGPIFTVGEAVRSTCGKWEEEEEKEEEEEEERFLQD